MTDDEAALRAAIIHILTSKPIWEIDFWLGPIHVDGLGLYQVVTALSWCNIGVKIGSMSVAGAAAEYHPRENSYVFPYKAVGLTPLNQMEIVHESVHAMFDIRAGLQGASFSMYQVENEAAAYIAGAIYGIIAFDASPSDRNGMQIIKAYEIANKIKDEKGAVVDGEDAKYLKHAVAVAESYHNRMTETSRASSDGVY